MVPIIVGISVSCEINDHEHVLSGEKEKTSAKAHGLYDMKVVHTINHLVSADAWTLESKLIDASTENGFDLIVNKSSVFGLGKLPKHWKPTFKYDYTWSSTDTTLFSLRTS